jgi:hypothetical protein
LALDWLRGGPIAMARWSMARWAMAGLDLERGSVRRRRGRVGRFR